MAFGWRADDGPPLALFGSSLPSSDKKNLCQGLTPSGKTFYFLTLDLIVIILLNQAKKALLFSHVHQARPEHTAYTHAPNKVFLFAVFSQSKWGGEGVGCMLSPVKWQGRVCERMSKTKFSEKKIQDKK